MLQKMFTRIGARVDVRGPGTGLDVARDRRGEFFVVGDDVRVVDTRPKMRHLLLVNRQTEKFLCGHDERHWFVAAIPERVRGVHNVVTAMEALKPVEVRARQERRGLKTKHGLRRRNAAFLRQGEWFFVPEPSLRPEPLRIFKDEPLSRGDGSKPHWIELCYRKGGQRVYVCDAYAAGLTEEQYLRLLQRSHGLRHANWEVRVRDAEVYAKGRVRHPDHKLLVLDGWHRVFMNRENEARAKRHVVFLD
jgi:hypothetical protein